MSIFGLDALRVELQVKISLEQTEGAAINNSDLLCNDSGSKFVVNILED
jgi:hypothetical protein